MKLEKLFLILLCAAAIALGLGANGDPVRIGVVDVEQAVTSTDDGKKARDTLQRKIKEAEAQLQPMADRYQNMMKEVESKQFVLSEDSIRQKRLDVAELQNQIVNRQREIQGQLEVERERLIGPIRERFGEIIQTVGKREGFTMILSRSAPGVIYTREALDITDLVVAEFNK